MSKRAWLYWMVPIGLLLLQVVKLLLRRFELPHSYFWGNLAGGAQLLVLLTGIGWFIVRRINRKRSDKALLLRSCIGVLVLVGGGEGLFAYWIQEPARIPAFFRSSFLYYNDHHNTRLLQYQRDGSQYDTGLFYTLKRNSRFSFSNAEFSTAYRTNAAGLRDDSASLNYPSVICLGDSYTMGWGVEQEESFPQQLERLSGRKVLNAGVSSYGTARELLLLQRLKLDSLQYLVIQYCDNDYGENKSFLDQGATLPISSKAVYDSLVTEQEWNTRYYPGKHFLLTTPLILKKAVNLLFPIFDLRQQRDILEDKPTNPYAAFYEVLARALPKNRPFTVIVLYMDSHDRVEAGSRSLSNAATAIKRAMDSTGVEIIPFQYGHLQKDQDYFKLDLHLTVSGNRKMAEWLNTLMGGHPSYGH